MKFSWRSYGVFLNIFKYVLVVVVLGVIAVTGYFSLQTKTSGEPPQLFRRIPISNDSATGPNLSLIR